MSRAAELDAADTLEVRGAENLPEGACLVASKHQSAWETFALIPLFRDPALLMKRSIPTSGLVVLPQSGHTINLEEPDAFNRALLEFFMRVETGRWGRRDTRSIGTGILGFR